jgi:hypothetical protein
MTWWDLVLLAQLLLRPGVLMLVLLLLLLLLGRSRCCEGHCRRRRRRRCCCCYCCRMPVPVLCAHLPAPRQQRGVHAHMLLLQAWVGAAPGGCCRCGLLQEQLQLPH